MTGGINSSVRVRGHLTPGEKLMQTTGRRAKPQRLRALERANAVRLARAELKRRIAEGDVCAAEIILGCPEEATSWSIGELLTSQRRWGTTRARKFLARNQISEIKEIGKLTKRQRLLLATQLQSCDPVAAGLESGAPGGSGRQAQELALVGA